MYRLIAALGVVLLSTLLSTEAFANPTPIVYHYCQFTPFNPPLRIYFSAAFGTAEIKDKKVENAFADYVSKKYSEKGSVGCGDLNSLAEAESQLKRNEILSANKQNNRKVIETGWQYDAAAASAAPSPAASSTPSAASSGRQFFHFCEAGGATRPEGGGAQLHNVPMPMYISDIYPVPMDKNIGHADGVAFAQFLGEKYDPYFKTARANCGGNFTSMEAAQAGKQQQEDTYRKNASLNRWNSNVIETGWKWAGAASR
jgi:hypothetical protein